MKERRRSGTWSAWLALAVGCAAFAVLAAVVLAASTGTSGSGSTRVRAPSLSLLIGLVTLVVLAIGVAVLASLVRTLQRGEFRDRHRTVRDLLRLAVIFVMLVVLFRILPIDRYRGGANDVSGTAQAAEGVLPQASGTDWATLVLIGLVTAVIGWRAWRTRRGAVDLDELAHTPIAGEVAEVLDDVIEGLRREADPRRAVIAAYARMEDVFARHGLPRRPSETPLEFLGRALEEITEPAPARRLTDLFESAMFSTQAFDRVRQHDAIDALVEVRDDLRRKAAAATPVAPVSR